MSDDRKYAEIDAKVLSELDRIAEISRLSLEAAQTCRIDGCARTWNHTPRCNAAFRKVTLAKWCAENAKAGAA